MPKIKVKGQTVQTGEVGQTRTWTDGGYQVYYGPLLVVNKDTSELIEVVLFGYHKPPPPLYITIFYL